MVCAFRGWNDAADAASSALESIADSLETTQFATIDPERYFDFTTNRPTIRLSEGRAREIEWPEWTIRAARAKRAPRDLILIEGPEPALLWRTFTRTIVELAESLEVQLVVTLGALLAGVPHRRPVGITGLASDEELGERLGMGGATYEGPTGITGVVHAACASAGIPAASLWATVPHYIAAAPSPKAALALVRRVEGLVGVTVDASELEQATVEYERQVELAVQSDPDVSSFVERLEAAIGEDDDIGADVRDISGETIAREFQRFLRQRGSDGGG
jgi:proteasome assembly chaperone (PAC2) family protein